VFKTPGPFTPPFHGSDPHPALGLNAMRHLDHRWTPRPGSGLGFLWGTYFCWVRKQQNFLVGGFNPFEKY